MNNCVLNEIPNSKRLIKLKSEMSMILDAKREHMSILMMIDVET